jgi:hypothetical protein
MKQLLSGILLLTSINLFAMDTLLEVKGTNIYEKIVSNWSNASQEDTYFDPTTLGTATLIGRCFYQNTQHANGAIIIIKQVDQDGGPLGNPGDQVSYGFGFEQFESSYFDYWNFDTYLTQVSLQKIDGYMGEINKSYGTFVVRQESNNLYFKKNYDGNIYAISNFSETPDKACYFFKNNN